MRYDLTSVRAGVDIRLWTLGSLQIDRMPKAADTPVNQGFGDFGACRSPPRRTVRFALRTHGWRALPQTDRTPKAADTVGGKVALALRSAFLYRSNVSWLKLLTPPFRSPPVRPWGMGGASAPPPVFSGVTHRLVCRPMFLSLSLTTLVSPSLCCLNLKQGEV